MQTSNEIKQNIKELLKRYYEVEKELKHIKKFDIGDGSDNDIKSSGLTLLWINIRSEIFYQRFLLVKSYEVNS